MKKKVSQEDVENYIRANWNQLKEKVVPLDEEFSKVIRDRQAICEKCPLFSLNSEDVEVKQQNPHCTSCGCAFPDITYAEKKFCPKGSWGPFIKKENKED